MKPTSVIFLIFSVILIASGVGVLFLAESMAENEGIALFSQSIDENGNLIEIYDYTDDSIDRISLTLGDADINVYGNSEKSYIELINFPKSTYDLSVNAKTININNTVGIFDYERIKENGLKFSGLRHYLNISDYQDMNKTVNIYIKPDETIKVYNFSIGNGNIGIENITNSADYSVNIDKGNLILQNVQTWSTVNIGIDKGDVIMNNSTIDTCSVIVNEGTVEYTLDNMDAQLINVKTGEGTVYLNGTETGDKYTNEPSTYYTKLNVILGKGIIHINGDKLS